MEVLREAAATKRETPHWKIVKISKKLPKDFYPTLKPHVRVESAALIFDERQRSLIDGERAAARQQACVADQEKVKSDERLAALRKELEEEQRRNDGKAKDQKDAKERVKAAANRSFKSSLTDPEVVLVPDSSAAATPAPSSTSTSRPKDDSAAHKDAQAAKKQRFRLNRGRR